MYCTNGFGYGHYWHFGNLILILAFLIGVTVLVFQLIRNNRNRVSGISEAANTVKSGYCPSCGAIAEEAYLRCPECNHKLKSNCQSCGKIINTDWVVCPYCETKSK